MSYSEEISRHNPTAFLFLVNQSGSMQDQMTSGRSKAQFLADAINRTHENHEPKWTAMLEIESQEQLERLVLANFLERAGIAQMKTDDTLDPALRYFRLNRHAWAGRVNYAVPQQLSFCNEHGWNIVSTSRWVKESEQIGQVSVGLHEPSLGFTKYWAVFDGTGHAIGVTRLG